MLETTLGPPLVLDRRMHQSWEALDASSIKSVCLTDLDALVHFIRISQRSIRLVMSLNPEANVPIPSRYSNTMLPFQHIIFGELRLSLGNARGSH